MALPLATVVLAAMLITSGLADEIAEDHSLKPVDLKKEGFDITLQALPAGERFLAFAVPFNLDT